MEALTKGGAERGEPLARAIDLATPPGDSNAGNAVDALALVLAEPGLGAPLVAPGEPARGATDRTPIGSPPGLESTLVEEVVRRVFWGGDRRRGVARVELGGAFAGTQITVEGEGSEVSVNIELAPGAELGELPERLRRRLAQRGVTLRSLEVR